MSYVANDVDTTLHEVRAGVFVFVCVGAFRLKEDITVVDLRAIAEIRSLSTDWSALVMR